jgi:hypothetical protein
MLLARALMSIWSGAFEEQCRILESKDREKHEKR